MAEMMAEARQKKEEAKQLKSKDIFGGQDVGEEVNPIKDTLKAAYEQKYTEASQGIYKIDPNVELTVKEIEEEMERGRAAGAAAYAEHCKKMNKPVDPLKDCTSKEDDSRFALKEDEYEDDAPPLEEVDPE